jgi:ubiquinone/menaquinone biosynthesis C-methylase UbiE
MKWFTRTSMKDADESPTLEPQTEGQIIRWPVLYELILWIVTRNREMAFRRFVTDLIELKPGEAVLDVGCGTGTQAVLAKMVVGDRRRVSGIEPSLEMVRYARRKAARLGLSIDIQPGVIERLDYPDLSFDVVLCVIVMHHMPDEAKRLGIREMARVLKPGGRLLVVDSNLQLLPPFEREGFIKVKGGEMPYVSSYDYQLWRIDPSAKPAKS